MSKTVNTTGSILYYQTLLDKYYSTSSGLNLSHLSQSLTNIHSYLHSARIATSTSNNTSTNITSTAADDGFTETYRASTPTEDRTIDPIPPSTASINLSDKCRSEIALSLLQLHVVRCSPSASSTVSTSISISISISTTERRIVESIDRCLDLCGCRISLLAAVERLRRIAASSSANSAVSDREDDDGIESIAAALRTVRRYVLATDTPVDANTNIEIHPHRRLLREFITFHPSSPSRPRSTEIVTRGCTDKGREGGKV